jgi:hypothetical protein
MLRKWKMSRLENIFAIFDNNGKTFDQFTIIRKRTGDMYGASKNPYHPQGFGQFCGNIKTDKGYNEFYSVGQYLKACRTVKDWQGEEVKDFDTLPEDVIKYLNQLA